MSFTAADILAVTKSVTKDWTRQRKAEDRGRRSRHSREYIYSDRVNFTDVVGEILPDAYAHASGDGLYPVSKRQLFYSSREDFKELTGRELEYGYFAGTLLVQYLNRNPDKTGDWKITADPRGTLTIPNAGHQVRIPCGTLQMDDHLQASGRPVDTFDVEAELTVEWPSLAAGQRYAAVLYIEKEGFEPLLREARIAERFDLAILSCKGQSVVAARRFVDEVCAAGNGVPLLVAHDFDKAGFEISQRLTTVSAWAEANDRVTYEFRNDIDVRDIGLRLADVEEYKLTGELCRFKGRFASDSIATKAEKDYLRSGRRVELNELTSPQFLKWLESKLSEHLPHRLIPDDETLEAAYRRALAIAKVNSAMSEAVDEAIEEAQTATPPKNLRERLAKALKGKNSDAWDRALYKLAEKHAG